MTQSPHGKRCRADGDGLTARCHNGASRTRNVSDCEGLGKTCGHVIISPRKGNSISAGFVKPLGSRDKCRAKCQWWKLATKTSGGRAGGVGGAHGTIDNCRCVLVGHYLGPSSKIGAPNGQEGVSSGGHGCSCDIGDG